MWQLTRHTRALDILTQKVLIKHSLILLEAGKLSAVKLWSCSLKTTEENSPSSRADNLHWGSESRQLHEGAARGETQRKGEKERKYFCDFNTKEKWRWNFLVLAFIFCFLFTFWIHFLAINLLTESLRQSTLICYMLLQCLCFIQSASFLYLLLSSPLNLSKDERETIYPCAM